LKGFFLNDDGWFYLHLWIKTLKQMDSELRNDFISFVKGIVKLSEKEVDEILKVLKVGRIKKKELLLKEGDICRKVVFFNKGYFRFFYNSIQGDEITCDFYFSPGFITSYTSLITEMPSFVNVQAMENMEYLELRRGDLYNLYESNPLIDRLGRLMAESVAIASERHLFLLLNQTADTRYRTLLAQHPEYVRHIPLQYIASYLGIKQETLSRIRKSI
jgi:CRP-like cAMP-binding protein